MKAAFLGLGLMGEPMAAHLVAGGVDLTVWNRSVAAGERLAGLGATVASSAAAALRAAPVAILMLQHAEAIDEVLDRDSSAFDRHVAGRILVNMGTVSPDYSAELARAVEAAGGQFVECPVSGSRGVAQTGDLVAMAAGNETAVAEIEPLLRLMTAHVFHCGTAPRALRTKLAVNLFLLTLVTGLAEAVNFARELGIEAGLFRDIIGAGPMASSVALGKLDKLLASDLTPQAAIRDVLSNCDLIHAEAQRLLIGTPMLDVCRELLKNAVDMGEDNQDMIGVIAAINRRTVSG